MAGLAAGGGFLAALTAIGTVVSAVGTIAAGQARMRAAEFEAKQLENQAEEERAAAQQQGFEIARQKRLAISRNVAVAAASGFSADDASTQDLLGEIEAYGTWQEQIANYGGESRAAGLRAQAKGARMTGRAGVTASYFDAASTIIGGATSMFEKYGSFKPAAAVSGYSLRYG